MGMKVPCDTGQLYISMHEGGGNAEVVSLNTCLQRNEMGAGAFVTVQSFKGERRITENLTKINAWAIDLDEGTKEQQRERIRKSPLCPSAIVEAKRGYHVYWKAIDARPNNFGLIQQALVDFFGADNRAKDLCRFLRLPDCNHWKDPKDPFMVHQVFEKDTAYVDGQMMRAFVKHKPKPKTVKSFGDFSGCKRGLELLSGAPELGGEQFTFRLNAKGTLQILVNGKSTSSWIALDGHIGSHDRGGPGLIAWVQWYKYTREEARSILRKYLGGEYERILGQPVYWN